MISWITNWPNAPHSSSENILWRYHFSYRLRSWWPLPIIGNQTVKSNVITVQLSLDCTILFLSIRKIGVSRYLCSPMRTACIRMERQKHLLKRNIPTQTSIYSHIWQTDRPCKQCATWLDTTKYAKSTSTTAWVDESCRLKQTFSDPTTLQMQLQWEYSTGTDIQDRGLRIRTWFPIIRNNWYSVRCWRWNGRLPIQ